MRGWFGVPVPVYVESAHSVIEVGCAGTAKRLLDEEWPYGHDDALEQAGAACSAAMEGGDALAARRAFEDAARDAGILAH